MIAVLADDLTGAAEMGGVGLHFGLVPEVQTHSYVEASSDLVVLDTDSRSVGPEPARDATGMAAESIRGSDLVYKKVDSVMRGNILAELEVLLPSLGMDRCLLIPANPTLGRTISGGEYLVKGVPLHRTEFSQDPEHPVKTPKVLELLGESVNHSVVLGKKARVIESGSITIGEATGWGDLRNWASHLSDPCLPAGGSDFFAAVLEERGYATRATPKTPSPKGPTLLVCGSSSDYSKEVVREAWSRGLPVSIMPRSVLRDQSKGMARWSEAILELLGERSMAIVAPGEVPKRDDKVLAASIRRRMAELVSGVLARGQVGELVVEGGATCSCIVTRIGWNRFFPVEEIARGVVRMRVDGEGGIMLTMKPGSYPWPQEIVLGRL